MTPNDQMIINDAIRKLRENVTSGMLLIEALSAILPRQKKEKPRGYITAPDGEKLWFDKTAKRRHERNKKLTLIK